MEKQRRDRINSLIDEVCLLPACQQPLQLPVQCCVPVLGAHYCLAPAVPDNMRVQLRDMVPPQSANSLAQDSTDFKRPKHVVLSDTIQLVRELQLQVQLLDDPCSQLFKDLGARPQPAGSAAVMLHDLLLVHACRGRPFRVKTLSQTARTHSQRHVQLKVSDGSQGSGDLPQPQDLVRQSGELPQPRDLIRRSVNNSRG